MGDHPNGPSKVMIDYSNPLLMELLNDVDPDFIVQNRGKSVMLSDVISLDPEVFLGPKYLEKFANNDSNFKLPFLFKVLSI